MPSPRLVITALVLALASPLAACGDPFTCVPSAGHPQPATYIGGQARIPISVADSKVKEAYAREVPLAKGDVAFADAAGQAFPGNTVVTDNNGQYQMNRVPAGQSMVVTVRAKTGAGTPIELRSLVRTGSQGARADVNVATTLATTALLEGQRGVVGDFDQGSYDKLVAKIYDKLQKVTSLNLRSDAAMTAQVKEWLGQDAEMRQLFDRLRSEVTAPKMTPDDQLRAVIQAQGMAPPAGLPSRAPMAPGSAIPTITPSAASSAAPSASPTGEPGVELPAGSPTPLATAEPGQGIPLNGEVTTIAGSDQGFADGLVGAARFDSPGGLAFDPAGGSLTLYVADTNNNRIRKIDLSNPGQPLVTTIAGTGSAGGIDGEGERATFNHPVGLAFGADGKLLVADSLGGKIRRVDVQPGYRVETVAALNADGQPSLPTGITVDPVSGAAYVTDALAKSVFRIANGQSQATRFATGLLAPAGVVADPNRFLWVTDAGQGLVDSVGADGAVSPFVGLYDDPAGGGPSVAGYAEGRGTQARFNRPMGLARHASGFLVVADAGNHRVRSVDPSGQTALLAGGVPGRLDGRLETAQFQSPSWVAIAPDGSVYVSDTGNHRIRRIS